RDLHWCKGRCDEPRGSDVWPGTAPAVERGTETVDCCGGICAWYVGERGGPTQGCRFRTDLSMAPGARRLCGGICRGGGVAATTTRDVGGRCGGSGDRIRHGYPGSPSGDDAQRVGVRGHQNAGNTMIAVPNGVRVWIAAGHTDMRRGMQGLARQVQETLQRD